MPSVSDLIFDDPTQLEALAEVPERLSMPEVGTNRAEFARVRELQEQSEFLVRGLPSRI